MPELVVFLLVFVLVGVLFLTVNMAVGRLIRPQRPNADKGAIYECGEPTIGSAWIQFDLRFYVVALLFVVFDVEMAFFFPWAVVFGNATQLAGGAPIGAEGMTADSPALAQQFAQIAFVDVLVFFGILLVGFAYLWKRGDLEWVRSTAAQSTASGDNEWAGSKDVGKKA